MAVQGSVWEGKIGCEGMLIARSYAEAAEAEDEINRLWPNSPGPEAGSLHPVPLKSPTSLLYFPSFLVEEALGSFKSTCLILVS
eukprot:407670-Pelagomonas_calceolata.AAC.8